MICLDTNYLIRGLLKGAQESAELIKWYQSGEVLLSAAPTWYDGGGTSVEPVKAKGPFFADTQPFQSRL